MERKFYFNVRSLMAVATTICLFASGCGSNATTSSNLPPKSNSGDVTAPMVTFEKMSMTIAPDKDFDPLANIISVKDSVDGDLEYVEGSGSKAGKYTVKADDMTKVGYHAVTVTATDSSGNKAVRYYQVKVTEDKKELSESEKNETTSETKKDTSSSNSKSSTSSSATKSNSSTKSSGSSSTSKPSSGLSNSNSTPKPSTGGSTSSGSNSVSKPSGGSGSSGNAGGSTSSGSSTASKPSTGSSSSSGSSTGSGSSGSSNGSTTKPTAPTCETVVVKEAWTETVVDKEAWTETIWIVDAPAYDEPIYEVKTICNECDKILNTAEEIDQHTMSDPNSPCFLAGYSDASVQTGIRHVPEVGHYETINHPAETHTVNHPAETKEVCS